MTWIKGINGRCQCDHCGDVLGSKENVAYAPSLYASLLKLENIHFCKSCNDALNSQIKPLLTPFLKVPDVCDVTEMIVNHSLDELIQFLIALSTKGYVKLELDSYECKICAVKKNIADQEKRDE